MVLKLRGKSMNEIDNIVLEKLNLFQAGQERIERKLEEVNGRLANLESGQASIIQHIGHLTSADAQQLATKADLADAKLDIIK
jgi:hypothetical protein